MSAPAPVRIDLTVLGLDDLGLLARHPQAPQGARRAFVRELTTWTRTRVATATRTMRTLDASDREDIVQDFLVACLTRHLRRWDPGRSTLTAYLFVRLRGAAIDAWRRRRTALRRDGGEIAAVVDQVAGDFDVEAPARARALDACFGVALAAVDRLPRRQRAVVRHVLQGDSLAEAAQTLGVHASTASRERAAALAQLRSTLEALTDDAPALLAAA
jgi:RNA polymerase sigma factor (sigma-70 family)